MPAAAAEAPVGNHHVLAIKKYALTKVISQMTMRRTRPMWRATSREGFSASPLLEMRKNPGITTVGLQTRGVYHSLLRAQAGCCVLYILLRYPEISADAPDVLA